MKKFCLFFFPFSALETEIVYVYALFMFMPYLCLCLTFAFPNNVFFSWWVTLEKCSISLQHLTERPLEKASTGRILCLVKRASSGSNLPILYFLFNHLSTDCYFGCHLNFCLLFKNRRRNGRQTANNFYEMVSMSHRILPTIC